MNENHSYFIHISSTKHYIFIIFNDICIILYESYYILNKILYHITNSTETTKMKSFNDNFLLEIKKEKDVKVRKKIPNITSTQLWDHSISAKNMHLW